VNISLAARLSAGVLGLVGGSLGLLLGLLLLLLGVVMAALQASNGGSIAASGALALVFGFAALGGAALFYLPWRKAGVIVTALSVAGLLWAFALIGAWPLALIPVIPLAAAILFGLAGLGGHEPNP
jgi:hypothetical protein